MTTYYLNGNPITEGSEITLNGFTYPYSWLEGTSPSIRASLGIEATGDINYNQKYYWNSQTPKLLEDVAAEDEQGNAVYVKVWDASAGEFGSMVDTEERLITKGLKTTCAEEVKSATNILLKTTDYYIIRNEVEGLEIPESVTTYRAAVIAEQDRVIPLIATVTTVEELIEVMDSIAWPKAE